EKERYSLSFDAESEVDEDEAGRVEEHTNDVNDEWVERTEEKDDDEEDGNRVAEHTEKAVNMRSHKIARRFTGDVPNLPKAEEMSKQVYFHFQTRACDDNGTVIDDSRKMGKPMELVLGKKFRFEVWETIVQMMAVNEVAKFKVDKSLVSGYPFVSKTLRDVGKPENQRQHHCCGLTLQNEGIGYADLNQLIKEPCDLEFIIGIEILLMFFFF
ncbi:AH receptor-interacting protein, partial [Gryllus bimaculatus]